MTDKFEPDRPLASFQDNTTPEADPASGFDSEAFRGFIDLLGPTQALFWLNEVRDGLCKEFGFPPAPPQTTLPSRAFIHHLCGRAGMMGFRGLHAACLGFLEGGPGQDVSDAALERIRAEAQLALQDIARQTALLA